MDTVIGSLTQKEVAVLQLLQGGHDAKSSAKKLGLSVHTVNERLRDARRKLGVTSSKEAARMVLEHTPNSPELLGDNQFGVVPQALIDQLSANRESSAVVNRALWLTGGMFLMSVVIAGFAAATLSSVPAVSLSAGELSSPLFLQSAAQRVRDDGAAAPLASAAVADVGLNTGGQSSAPELDLMPFADSNGDEVVSVDEYERFSEFTWGIVSEGADEIRVDELDAGRVMGVIGIMPNAHGMITRRMYMAAVPSRFAMLDIDRDEQLSAEEINGKHYQAKALAYLQ